MNEPNRTFFQRGRSVLPTTIFPALRDRAKAMISVAAFSPGNIVTVAPRLSASRMFCDRRSRSAAERFAGPPPGEVSTYTASNSACSPAAMRLAARMSVPDIGLGLMATTNRSPAGHTARMQRSCL